MGTRFWQYEKQYRLKSSIFIKGDVLWITAIRINRMNHI